MLGLLLLSLVLSAPSAAAQTAVAPTNPLAGESTQQILISPEAPLMAEDAQGRSFDPMEIHPDSDICFKIRTYVFTPGPHPKFLRETTCGPRPATTKKIDGFKPGLMPVGVTGDATTTASPR